MMKISTSLDGKPAHVTVLAREAALGKGKRRLAATVGDDRALEIYRELITTCATVVRNSGLRSTIYFEPSIGDADIWWGPVLAKAEAFDSSQSELRHTNSEVDS